MKLWVDDVRPAPEGYVHIFSVNQGINVIKAFPLPIDLIEVIDIDHDAGDYAADGGDYIKLLDWLEEKGYNIPIHIHSMNPVGILRMRSIIKRNGWKEI